MKSTFDLSVIVPTYNRRQALSRLLDSLEKQQADGVSFEVLVVDNNSRDDTRSVVASYERRGRLMLRYLLEPRPGVSHARNTGVAHSRAPILAFLDDDVEAAQDWVATVQRTFAQNPGIDCIGGPVQPQWPHRPPSWLTPALWSPVALQDKRPWLHLSASNAWSCMATENFACRREAFVEVGGFDPTFVRGQDREFQLRLWGAGKEGLYTPELVATTAVPPERMTKAYHRRWYVTRGRFLAMMRYHDRIDRDGRLVDERRDTPRFFGTPLFLYRDFLGHAVGWLGAVLRFNWNDAFYHETRLRDCGACIVTRYRMEYGSASLRSHLASIGALLRHLVAPRAQAVGRR